MTGACPTRSGTPSRSRSSPAYCSTITTLLGLLSLNVSHILPVRQFGYAAALGAVVAIIVGLTVTPALVVVWPDRTIGAERRWFDFAQWGRWVSRRRVPLLSGACVLARRRHRADSSGAAHRPVDFLQKSNPVAIDLRRVNEHLTSIGSVEFVVDTGLEERPFVEKMLEVRRIQAKIDAHPAVRHSFAVPSLFPDQLPDSMLASAQMFSNALEQGSGSGYLAQNQRLWRITIRAARDWKSNEVCDALDKLLADEPVTLTGVSPLIADAQHEIFSELLAEPRAWRWRSITVVMILSLRSIVSGLIAMVPNILPIWFVFGIVGFMGMPVDIGMMMTGSIAIGISVDCTFHYLVKYQEEFRKGLTSVEASCAALAHTGKPLMESTVISSLGMLALCLSRFTPTSRFGWLMAALMLVSVVGELILLPVLLCLRPNRRHANAPARRR